MRQRAVLRQTCRPCRTLVRRLPILPEVELHPPARGVIQADERLAIVPTQRADVSPLVEDNFERLVEILDVPANEFVISKDVLTESWEIRFDI